MLTQRFDNGMPCPIARDPALTPGPVGCVSEARADLDGDGAADRFLLFAELNGDGTPRRWRAVADLSGVEVTPAVTVPTGQGVATIYPRVIGAADANGDGRTEVFVKLSAILYHVGGEQIEGVFGVADGHVRPVTAAGGGRFTFRAGGISRYGDGALCAKRDGRSVLVIRHVEQVLPSFWERTERTFAWDGLTIRQVARRSDRKPLTLHITDPPIAPYYQLDCGPVHA
jgi:FG-GAP-like repeat